MKIVHQLSDATTVEIEAETQAEMFKSLAQATEVFGHAACGVCSGDIGYRVRIVEECTYHELFCKSIKCRAVLAFGQNRKGGGLFPKRKDSEGRWLAHNGWTVYVPEKN